MGRHIVSVLLWRKSVEKGKDLESNSASATYLTNLMLISWSFFVCFLISKVKIIVVPIFLRWLWEFGKNVYIKPFTGYFKLFTQLWKALFSIILNHWIGGKILKLMILKVTFCYESLIPNGIWLNCHCRNTISDVK